MDFTNYLTMRSSNLATVKATTMNLSTLTGSTLSLTTHITAPMGIYSTLTGSTMHGSTVFLSSIRASFLTLSTLTVSSINNNAPGTGTGSFSTLTVSSLVSVSSISSASTIYTSSLLTTGNVGIGTAAPGYTLHVQGAIYASGNITALSDQRHKQNIIRLDHSLDAIRSLSGYYYTRDDYQPGIRQIGLLAQEVNKVIPEAVSYDSANDTYSLNYGCLIAPMIEAVKEINEKVDSRISELENKINTQQVLLQQLMDRTP